MRAVEYTRNPPQCNSEEVSPRNRKSDDGLDRLLADPRLGSTTKAIAIALVRRWAWYASTCWPGDPAIARAVGKSPGHVQRCLLELERAGWIVREKTRANRTGRLIRLLWREDGARGGPATAREEPTAPARDERIVIVKERIEPIVEDISRPRPEILLPPMAIPERTSLPETPPPALSVVPPAPSEPEPTSLPTQARTQAGRLAELQELLKRTPGDKIIRAEFERLVAPPAPPEPLPGMLATPDLLAKLPGRFDLVIHAAQRICQETRDGNRASFNTFAFMAKAVAEKYVSPAALADCLRQAQGPKAKHAGKVMIAAWKRAVPG